MNVLPMTRNMPYSAASVPSHGQPRNMTGIYLGLEGNQRPPRAKSGVPPLARSRGMSRIRTPMEEQRYFQKLKKCPLQTSDGKRVELLRVKEEKRGFSGNPVKRHQQPTSGTWSASHAPSSATPSAASGRPKSSAPRPLSSAAPYDPALTGYCSHSPAPTLSEPSRSRRWGPGKRINTSNLDDQLRPSTRNFTAVINSGVTRSEKLTGWQGVFQSHLHDDSDDPAAREAGLSDQVDLAGLEECFRKVCQFHFQFLPGNIEVLYSLLPGKRPQPKVSRENTGFSVRSYRNPKQAEILADFPTERGNARSARPKTVPGIRRPHVPQPYFFRNYLASPGAATIAPQQLRYLPPGGIMDETRRDVCFIRGFNTGPNYLSSPQKIAAAPGAGSISRLLHQRIQTPVTGNGLASRPRTEPHRVAGETHHPTSPVAKEPPVLSLPGNQFDRKCWGLPAIPTVKARCRLRYTSQVNQSANPSDQLVEDTSLSAKDIDSEDSGLSSHRQGLRVNLVADPDLAEGRNINANTAPDEDEARASPEDDNSITSSNTDRTSLAMEKGESHPDLPVTEVKVPDEPCSTTEDSKPRPKLTASNSGADIMLGLETDEGQSAEVEIDTADQDELLPEAEVPKGRVRKASITEKVIKTKASEALAAMIKEEAETRQKEFEKLLDEHAELVQEISRTPSSENLIQGERDH